MFYCRYLRFLLGIRCNAARVYPYFGDKIKNGENFRTVAVRECCKGDDASQWGNGKVDPLSRPNPITDRHKKLRTWLSLDIFPFTKFSRDPSRGFFSPYARICIKDVYSASFFSAFLQWPTAQAPEPIFTRNTSNDVVPRKDVPFRG